MFSPLILATFPLLSKQFPQIFRLFCLLCISLLLSAFAAFVYWFIVEKLAKLGYYVLRDTRE